MTKRLFFPAVAAVVPCLLPALSVRADGRSFEAEGAGRGETEAQALDNALHAALASIWDEYQPTFSKGRKEQWTRRLVMAYPKVVIQRNFDVLQRTSGRDDLMNGLASVRVKVRVSEAALDNARKEAEVFIKEIGNPTVSVFAYDVIEWLPVPRREIQEKSDVAQQFLEALESEHFKVIIHEHAAVLRERQVDFAELRGRGPDILKEIATKDHAHIYIHGMGRVMGPVSNDRLVPGKVKHVWQSDAKFTAFWTDNAEQLAPLDFDAGGCDDGGTNGRIIALKRVGEQLAPRFMDVLFKHWSREAFEGRTITITIERCSDDEADAIEDALKAMDKEFEVLHKGHDNGVATFEVQTKLGADELDRAIRKADIDKNFKLKRVNMGYRTARYTVIH